MNLRSLVPLRVLASEEWRWVKDMIQVFRSSGLSLVSDSGSLRTGNDPRIDRVVNASGHRCGRLATGLIYTRYDRLDMPYPVRFVLDDILKGLVQTSGCLSVKDFPAFVDAYVRERCWAITDVRIAHIAEEIVKEHGLQEPTRRAIRKLIDHLRHPPRMHPDFPAIVTGADRKNIQRLERILDPGQSREISLDEDWQQPFNQPCLRELVAHAASSISTKPTSKWLKSAPSILERAGVEPFLDAFEEAVGAIARSPNPVDFLTADMLRGLCWFCTVAASPRAISLLGRMALACAHKLPGHGARCLKGYTGAVGSLEHLGNFDSLAQLSKIRNRVKTPSLSATILTALERSATRQNLSLDELEELVVPTHGLELPGVRSEILGEIEGRLQVDGATGVRLRWFKNGSEQKSTPAVLKETAGADLRELKAAAKEVEQTLSAQVRRLEGMMMTGRTLPYGQWRERYFQHPLLANMVRRLIWRFGEDGGERLGIAPEGELIDLADVPFEPDDQTPVRLWHPIEAGVSAIEAARDFLVRREIRQPFKQAFREVYILTDAEIATDTYSNRFAAHILKQHQMRALASQRGWRYALQGAGFDSVNSPTLDLPKWDIRAEYDVEVPDYAEAADHNAESASGIALYVLTNQVRFSTRDGFDPVRLLDIPPIVFSEVMRDVDLFVGVCSVGNDPAWMDRGHRTFGEYWQGYSFGELSTNAQTRADALRRLLPHLSIGKAAQVQGRFLVVQGKLRTYKIHLGSGNILMEPNDQYLCIVPERKKNGVSERVYLPFESDGTLAIIISKAVMLADDDKISDISITRQIKIRR